MTWPRNWTACWRRTRRVRETTLLIAPGCLHNFLDFNDFLAQAERLLRKRGLQGVIQLASFHPGYQFAGTDADDITNFTNRSPYPTLHLLREASIDRAVQAIAAGGGHLRGQHEDNAQPGTGRLGRAWRRAQQMKAEELELRPGQSTELLQGTAHPHPRGADQPGLAPQAQAGLSPLPVHREAAAGAAAEHRMARPWPIMAPASPTSDSSCTTCSSSSAAAGTSTASRPGRSWWSDRAQLAARLGFERMSFLNVSAAEAADADAPAGADRRRHGAARLRHGDRRRDRVRPAQAGALHGAGALLPGGNRRLPAPEQGAGTVAHAAWRSCGAIPCTRGNWAAS